MTRILLAGGFGLLAALLLKAGFLPGYTPSNVDALLALCAMAGFSQRFVPEMLGKMETEMSVKAPAGSASRT